MRSAFVALPFALLGSLPFWTASCTRKAQATTESADLFTTACARCHGPEGRGGLPLWEGGPSPRNFHDHAFQQSRTNEEIMHTIRNGKGGMPPFGTLFSDEQVAQLVLQIRSFDDQK
jgi:mono/diheme cytochrome c family protein